MVTRVRTIHYYTHIDAHLFIHALMCVSTGSSFGKKSACSEGDLDSIPGLGRSPGEGNGYPLQYSCLGNSMDREAWWAIVDGVTRVGHN